MSDYFKKVGPAHCMVSMPNGRATIEVLNPTKRPIKLTHNMCVGYADTSAIGQIQQRLSLKAEPRPEAMAATMKSKKSKDRRQLAEWKKEKYPYLEANDPRLYLTDAEIIEKDIRLDTARLSEKGKKRLMSIIHDNAEAFSLHSDVGSCDDSNIRFEVLKDEGLFIRPYKASPADRTILEDEVQKLVQIIQSIKTS